MSRPQINDDVFDKLRGRRFFNKYIPEFYAFYASGLGVSLTFEAMRLDNARLFWVDDVSRVAKRVGGKANHFKQAGFLAFWLRRECPVRFWDDTKVDYDRLSKSDQLYVENIMNSGREIIPFLIGFEICRHFEEKSGYRRPLIEIYPSYLTDMIDFLQRRSVSPHSMHMIYQSLFTPFYKRKI